MPSPALDTQPDTDEYTQAMVDAFSYIQKGSAENGNLSVSEIHAFYCMFEEEMVESKQDFIYLIHQMNQPILDDIKDKLEQTKKGH